MLDILMGTPQRTIATALSAIVLFLVWFSVDIWMFLTKRHFGEINFYLVYFTRGDKGRTSSTDALHLRTIGYRVPMKQVFPNRFLFWQVIIASERTPKGKSVISFGKYYTQILAPVRGWIARLCAGAEFKRAAGFTFKEIRHQIVIINGRSEDKSWRILKVLVIKESDLKGIEKYMKNPPQAGENFELFQEIADEFKTTPSAFLHVQIVAA